MKSTYYVASSLDGFIADSTGGVDWLDEVQIDAGDSSYAKFYAGVDALMMGRATYDFVFDYGAWPYGEQPCWVISSQPVSALPGCNLQPEREISSAWNKARAMGSRHLWVIGGGKLVSALIQQRLLTHIQVTVMPVILGSGIRLVDALPAPQFLMQEQAAPGSGSTEIIYQLDA